MTPRPPRSTLFPYTTLFRSDADRLAGDQRERIRAGGPDLAVHLVDRLRVPLDRLRGARDVDGERVPDRLADVEGLEERELLALLADPLREPEQDPLPVRRRPIRPAAIVERPARGRHGAIDILRRSGSDPRDQRSIAPGQVIEGRTGGGRRE